MKNIDDTRLWGWLGPEEPDLFAHQPGLDVWLASRLGLPALLDAPPVAFDPRCARDSTLEEDARAALFGLLGQTGLSEDPLHRARLSLGQSYSDQLARRSGTIPSVCDAVASPHSAEALLALLELAQAHAFHITPVGGATNVVGAIGPPEDNRPWVVVDMTHLRAIKAVSPIDRTITVEAGASLVEIEAHLGGLGFTLGHFPQSFMGATIGGSIMAHGAGQSSDGYGRIADMLVSAKLATPRGWWSTETFRHAGAGPWLGGLVAGSEGLFGILTEAKLRIRSAPETIEDRAWALPAFSAGAEAIRTLAQSGHGLTMLRLSDEAEFAFYSEFRLRRKGLLTPPLLERAALALTGVPRNPAFLIASYEGQRRQASDCLADAARVLTRAGGVALGALPGRSWRRDRFSAPHWRESLMRRGVGVETFETATCWSKLEALHTAVGNALRRAVDATAPSGARGIAFAHLSHSYPEGASLYFTTLFPQANDPHAQWRQIKCAALDAVMAAGGALSHHHGLGADHAPWAEAEKSLLGVAALRALSNEFDPNGVLATGAKRALLMRHSLETPV